MTRENPETHPYVVGYDACSLYLSSFGLNHFTGRPTMYENGGSGILQRVEGNKVRKSSKIAEEYLDTMQEIEHPNQLMVLEGVMPLSNLEIKYIQQAYAQHNIDLSPPRRIYVDGVIKAGGIKKIFEFDGCYYHGCRRTEKCRDMTSKRSFTRCTTKLESYVDQATGVMSKRPVSVREALTFEQMVAIDEAKSEVMRMRGYEVVRMPECRWMEERRHNPRYVDFVKKRVEYESVMNAWSDNSGLIPCGTLLNKIRSGEVSGLAFVDIYTPEALKSKYEQFAPIIKHASVKMKDVGPYMQKVANQLGIKIGPEGRNMVIDSYFGENIGLTCDSIRQLLSMGLVVSNIHLFIRYKPFPIFAPFVDKITKLRMEGDKDRSKSIIATMAKLLGNSAFGSCITDVEKHTDVKIIVIDGATALSPNSGSELERQIASHAMFRSYEVVNTDIIEISSRKKTIIFNQLRQISNVIFDKSKMTMRQFILFCFEVLQPDSYRFMSTDTDSIYIAFKNGPNFEDNIDPAKAEYYESEKHKYFVTPAAKYGARTPGLFKIEAQGSNMVALCAKSYVVFDEGEDFIKFSCKGVQKDEMYKLGDRLRSKVGCSNNAYKNIYDTYRREFKENKTHMITNRGMKRTNDVFTTYEQQKRCSTSFYCKRRVLNDGVSTVPLNI
eukprot:Seg1956.10 transcript_id=Seg1956.10/GoldUCD/mRNA.D3Y31 product="hypothetical protein" protein_id=Seg1956.10/GoldUCD/D3Y31